MFKTHDTVTRDMTCVTVISFMLLLPYATRMEIMFSVQYSIMHPLFTDAAPTLVAINAVNIE